MSTYAKPAVRKALKMIDFVKRAYVINLRNTSLTPVKQIKASFNPFDPKCNSIRHFTYSMSVPKVKRTNVHCGLKVDVKSAAFDPLLEIDFVDGHKAVFHTANLTKVELVQLFNKMCEDKAVKLPPTTEKNIGDNKKGKKRR